jgi:hypothetical protein
MTRASAPRRSNAFKQWTASPSSRTPPLIDIKVAFESAGFDFIGAPPDPAGIGLFRRAETDVTDMNVSETRIVSRLSPNMSGSGRGWFFSAFA